MTAGHDPVLGGAAPEPAVPDGAVVVDRVDVRLLARMAAIAIAVVVVIGAVAGIVWGLVVPGVTGVVVAPDRAGALGADVGHRFDAVALFACISFVAGVIGGVGTWWIRPLRGSAGAASAAVGAMGGAAVGVWIGGIIAAVRHPGPGDTAVGQFFSSAPSLRLATAGLENLGGLGLSWAIVVVAPIGALLSYLVLLLAVRRADLGVRRQAGPDESASGRRSQGGELVGDA